jgi:hypothetical protein
VEDTRVKARNNITLLDYYLEERNPKQSKDGYEPKHVLLVDETCLK